MKIDTEYDMSFARAPCFSILDIYLEIDSKSYLESDNWRPEERAGYISSATWQLYPLQDKVHALVLEIIHAGQASHYTTFSLRS